VWRTLPARVGPLWPRRSALAALAVALAYLVPAAPAGAVESGIVMGRFPESEQRYQSVDRTGAPWVRAYLNWGDFEPTRGTLSVPWAYDYGRAIDRLRASGHKIVIVVSGAPSWATGSSDPHAIPRDSAAFGRFADAYASFMGRLAAHFRGRVAAWEIWNEEDSDGWWSGAPQPGRYARLLRGAHDAVKAADPAAKVVVGGLTGNNYQFVDDLYRNGARGSFDAVGVHTDIACDTASPYHYFRESNGRVSRWSFLGWQSVHDVMARHGDGDKPVWLTEVGWSTQLGSCPHGAFAGKKPAGVSEAEQANFLGGAYHCMSQAPYVQVAIWFALQDADYHGFGLLRSDGSQKPAYDALSAFAKSGDRRTEECGDFVPPTVTITSPVEGARYRGPLRVIATASDASGIKRYTTFANGKKVHSRRAETLDVVIRKARKWKRGKKTIKVRAVDAYGNLGSASVTVTHLRERKRR